ncbi:MAG: histidine phosphatase family protein [Candidatus Methylomirabilota bacterium]
MDLILWRHAEAEASLPDANRRLTSKGQKQAKRMAAWLRKRLPDGAVVLTSPARRALETAHALRDTVETREELGTGGSVAALLKAAGWPRGGGTVVVVGHQPTLGEAAAFVLTGRKAAWGLKKGGIIWLLSSRRDGGGGAELYAALPPSLL